MLCKMVLTLNKGDLANTTVPWIFVKLYGLDTLLQNQ